MRRARILPSPNAHYSGLVPLFDGSLAHLNCEVRQIRLILRRSNHIKRG